MNKYTLLFALLVPWLHANAQSSPTAIGARFAGMGYASAGLTDAWGMLSNVAGIAGVKQASVAFAHDVQPSFAPFNRSALVAVVPLPVGVVGAGLYRFGDKLYNEQVATIGYANTMGIASIGVQASYIQYNVDGFGTRGVMSISAGGIATLTPHIAVAAYALNITQPMLSRDDGERLPTRLVAGLRFTPAEHTAVTTEVEKDWLYTATWRTGIEYRPVKKFVARTGFAVRPNAVFGGVGFRSTRLCLDYAFQYRPTAGHRHQATVGYTLTKPKA